MTDKLIISKVINSSKDEYYGDVLLYELNSLEEENLDIHSSLFRSGRHKNDMPSVCRFGVFDDAMKDAAKYIKEDGSGAIDIKGNLIVSDALTIIGTTKEALAIASLSSKHNLIRTEIVIDDFGYFKSLKVYAEVNRFINKDESVSLDRVLVKRINNVNEFIKDWSINLSKVCDARKKKAPAVYCTWYYYHESVTLDDVKINLNKIKELNLPLDTFQIDDGWERMVGDWTLNSKFNLSLSELASLIKSYGLTPGIWTSPFIAYKTVDIWKKHPEWILKDNDSNPILFNVNNKDFYIFDITIKETWNYFYSLYKSLNESGFKYHKLDFTRAPFTAKNPNFSDKHASLVECYIKACKEIRRGIGEDAFLLMCGGLYEPLIGIVDAQRTSSDILSMWSDPLKRGGKSLPYIIKQNLLRYYMNNYWYNDPDSLTIRRNKIIKRNSRLTLGLLNDIEANTSIINQLLGAGIFSMTEPLDLIDMDRLNLINKILPYKNIKIEMENLLEINRFPSVIDVFNKDTNEKYKVFINYNDSNSNIEYKDFRYSLKPHESIVLKIDNNIILKDNGYYID